MKTTTLLFLGILIGQIALSQNKEFPLKISYFSRLVIEPGIKFSSEFTVKSFTKEKVKETKPMASTQPFRPQRHLLISPEVGVFSKPKNHVNVWANAALGYRLQKKPNKLYNQFSVGVGYLFESKIQSTLVDLTNGEEIAVRASRHNFVPNMGYEIGKTRNERLGWFTKVSIGWKINGEIETILLPLFEIGIRINLKTK